MTIENKRKRREIPSDFICQGIKQNGEPCTLQHTNNSLYCKIHHPKKLFSTAETNTVYPIECHHDKATNTNDTLLDIQTANETILLLIDENIEKQRIIDELVNLYTSVNNELDSIQSI